MEVDRTGALTWARRWLSTLFLGPSGEGTGVPIAVGNGIEQKPEDCTGVRAEELWRRRELITMNVIMRRDTSSEGS